MASAQFRACLEGAARGDQAAIVALYPLATAEYRRYARGCGFDPDDVEDVVSEAFVSLLEELRATDDWSANESWELIAHARRAANRRRNRREYGIDPESILASAVLPVDDWEEAQAEADRRDAEAEEEERRRSFLRRAIESSRPYPRYYLSLRLLDGRPPREISGITGEMPGRVTRRIHSLTANLKNRLRGRPPRHSRSERTDSDWHGTAGSLRPALSPTPSDIRLLVEEFCSESPDGSAAECLHYVTETTGLQLERVRFYTDFWIRRRASRARARGQVDQSPPRAHDDFRMRDGQLRPAGSLTWRMRAQIRAFVLVLREDDPGVSAREAMRKAGEHHGVLFKDIHSFRGLYFSAHGCGQRIGKGSGGLRALKGRTPQEIEEFVQEVLQRQPEATASDVLRATNLALGTAIKAEAPFRARYVAPARRRLGIPNPPPPARAWTPPCPPDGWRAAGTLSRDEREHVVAWLREQLLADEDAAGAELFRRAREEFRVDWRRSAQFTHAYLWRARREPGADDASVRRPSAEGRKRITNFIRVQLGEDPSLSASRLMRMVNHRFGTGFSSPGTFRQRYVTPVRNELRDRAGSSSLPSHPLEPRMATPAGPAATSSPRPNPFAQRSSVYTDEQKTRALDWLVHYITANPRCTTTAARAAVQDAIQIRIAKGSFHNGFFNRALERCAPEIRALRGKRPSTSAPPAAQRASLTDRQKARMRQMVACLKRDSPDLLTNLPELMARATSLDGVHYNDVVAFRQHYVDPVAPAAPGDPYPEPMAAAHRAPAPARNKVAKAPVPQPQPSHVSLPPREMKEEVATQETASPPAALPTAKASPLPANILAVLAADPLRAIRLEGVEGAPGQARILMDIGPLAMADAARLCATIYDAVADVLS
jgi:RNA polymerase sigma factor (sigma-70 family)